MACLPASAATPEFGDRRSDLARVGLTELGLRGASASEPTSPRTVNAVVADLSLEEKTTHANVCLRKVSEFIAPALE